MALLPIAAILCQLFQFSAQSLIGPACVVASVLFAWMLWSWWRTVESWFDPYMLFLVAAMLFNGGQVILEVFHLNEKGILDSRFSPEITLQAIFLVMLGLTAFHLGALISAAVTVRVAVERSDREKSEGMARRVRQVGWFLLVVAAVPAFLLLRDTLLIVLQSGYEALYQQQAATGWGAWRQVVATFLVPGALFLTAGSKGRWINLGISSAIILCYAALQFFIGSRSSAVMPLVAYAWLWHRCIRPLPAVLLVGTGAIVLFGVLPLVAAVRELAGQERLALPVLVDAFRSVGNPAASILSEMGTSMRTIAHTIDLVPRVRGFDMGIGYLYAALTVIPNLFWDIHPTVARGLAGDWLVQTVAPDWATLGFGLGFSFIAEAFLNFGWLGTPFALGIIGYAFTRLVLWAQRSDQVARTAAVASFLSFFLMFARGESATIIRPLIWYALLPYALAVLPSRLKWTY